MSEVLNVAIVGFGGMGNMHRQMINEGARGARKIGAVPRMRVTGAFDIKEERQHAAIECGLTAYPSLDALLADASIDLIICATPNDVHAEIVTRALNAGKHVICEKPAALSVAELDGMEAAAKRAGRFLTVHQNRRWDQDFLSIKALCERGELGKPLRVESRVQGSRGIPGDWRKQREHGGGMLLDWGVHLLDQALFMFPRKVSAVCGELTYSKESECDDGIRVTLWFDNGLSYSVEVGTHNAIALPRWYLVCENGAAVIENWNMDGSVLRMRDVSRDAAPIQAASGITKTMAPREGDSVEHLPLPRFDIDVSAFYNNVADVILDGAESAIRIAEVRRVLRLMDAIAESARTRQIVAFE